MYGRNRRKETCELLIVNREKTINERYSEKI